MAQEERRNKKDIAGERPSASAEEASSSRGKTFRIVGIGASARMHRDGAPAGALIKPS